MSIISQPSLFRLFYGCTLFVSLVYMRVHNVTALLFILHPHPSPLLLPPPPLPHSCPQCRHWHTFPLSDSPFIQRCWVQFNLSPFWMIRACLFNEHISHRCCTLTEAGKGCNVTRHRCLIRMCPYFNRSDVFVLFLWLFYLMGFPLAFWEF